MEKMMATHAERNANRRDEEMEDTGSEIGDEEMEDTGSDIVDDEHNEVYSETGSHRGYFSADDNEKKNDAGDSGCLAGEAMV